ncbi:CCAAT- binding transcription factor component [Meyerozyma guilliermondii]
MTDNIHFYDRLDTFVFQASETKNIRDYEHQNVMESYENEYIEDGEDLELSQHRPETASQSQPETQNVVDEAELLAAQAAAEEAAAQQQHQPGGAFHNVGQGLTGRYRDMMMQYWQETINSIEHDDHDFKNHQLPLARIKKVMKTDEDVKMISAEAPILFAKGCDVFITELTMRAWIHAEENKRRTLQKSDIAAALTKSDMFDFLIDVVPREEEKPKKAAYMSAAMSRPTYSTNYSHHQVQLAHPSQEAVNGDASIKNGAQPIEGTSSELHEQEVKSEEIAQEESYTNNHEASRTGSQTLEQDEGFGEIP